MIKSATNVHLNTEPGVIDNEMLTRCVLDKGPIGEAGRLFAEEGVHLEEIQFLILEFQNILKIDHLSMLKSLTRLTLSHNVIEKIDNLDELTGLIELDLSFNKIERIENLDTLVNVEVLSLFNNKIRKIENMDNLEKLLIFSIGDNVIEDYKEVAYLRNFRFLRSLSFKGNPCCDDDMTYKFIYSTLRRVTYVDYRKITNKEREEGRDFFRDIIRKLEEDDEERERERIKRDKSRAKVEFYAQSFVEHLNGSEHFETMFQQDTIGSLYLLTGGEITEFYEQYKEQYVDTMSDLVVFAQEQYRVRENEVKAFKEVVSDALDVSVAKSKGIIAAYNERKPPLLYKLNTLIEEFTNKTTTLEVLEPKLIVLREEFNELLDDVWKKLMKEELRLYEECEETRMQFAVNLTELVNKLLEISRNAFGLWREHECVWSMRAGDALAKLIGNDTEIQNDVSKQLLEMLSERDTMMNAVTASTNNHTRFINAREDRLISRATKWKDNLISNTNNNETKRNRERILEINYYLDNQRADWKELQMRLAEPPRDTDAVALMLAEIPFAPTPTI